MPALRLVLAANLATAVALGASIINLPSLALFTLVLCQGWRLVSGE